MLWQTVLMQRVAIYARTSTDRNQTVENQLLQLNEVAARLGWVIVQVYTDEGISGTKGRDRRPAFDLMISTMRVAGIGIRRIGVGTPSVMRIKQTFTANAA